MTVSKSTKEFAATVYKRAFGVDPMEVQQQLKHEQKRAEDEQKRAEHEQKRAEHEQKRAEHEQKRAEHEQKRAEQEIVNIIRNLSQTLGLSVDEIAKMVSKDVDYIQAVLQAK